MTKKKYKRIGKGKTLKFAKKCANVVKEIVELELGPILLPQMEYLLARSMEDWIEECDIEKEAIWKKKNEPPVPLPPIVPLDIKKIPKKKTKKATK